MTSPKKLLRRAKQSAKNLRFTDLCALARAAGFEEKRQVGSHIWFYHPGIADSETGGLSLQEAKGGKAKPYQVRQLLKLIAEHGLVQGEEVEAAPDDDDVAEESTVAAEDAPEVLPGDVHQLDKDK